MPDPSEGELLVELGKAHAPRAGGDVTLVAWSRITHVALQAAELLAKEGIAAEVLDSARSDCSTRRRS